MLDHHRATIERAVARLRGRDDVLAILIGGSIAHGFATASSDVDLLIVVSDSEWERRLAAGDVTELDRESAAYPGGYVDGKYTSVGFMRAVAERGTEQARYALDGAAIAWSRIQGLEEEVRVAARYPVEGVAERIAAFAAQLGYWRWMYAEGERTGNPYVQALAAPHVVLFAGRIVLARNAMLYPGTKWLVERLRGAPVQPPGLMAAVEAVVVRPTTASIEALANLVGEPDETTRDGAWGGRFMIDTELAWLHGGRAVADL